jgi:hypothetical protein
VGFIVDVGKPHLSWPGAEAADFASLMKENDMKMNVGTWDRIARAVVGLVLIGATIAGWIGAWGWIGVVPLATAAFSFCPLYAMLGISSGPATPSHT